MRTPRLLMPQVMDRLYHEVSRVVGRRMICTGEADANPEGRGGGCGEAAAMADYRVFLFEERSEEKTQDNPASPEGYAGASKTQDTRIGEWKTRVGIDARKVWEERKRGGRLPLHVMLRLKSRYLVDGAAIGGAEFLRRLTGGSEGLEEETDDGAADWTPTGTGEAGDGKPKGREGVAMRFGQWGGLRVLRDLRVRVVG